MIETSVAPCLQLHRVVAYQSGCRPVYFFSTKSMTTDCDLQNIQDQSAKSHFIFTKYCSPMLFLLEVTMHIDREKIRVKYLCGLNFGGI